MMLSCPFSRRRSSGKLKKLIDEHVEEEGERKDEAQDEESGDKEELKKQSSDHKFLVVTFEAKQHH